MRTSIKLFLSIGALVCASIFPSAARADITGDTLNFSYYFPDPGTLESDEGNFLANGVPHDFQGYFTYAATSTQFIFTIDFNFSFFYGPREGYLFNGPVITDFSQSLFGYTVVLDPSSTATGYLALAPTISFNQFSANFGDVNIVQGATLIFDLIPPPPIQAPPPPPPVSAATPEPSSLALLGTGLLGVVGMVRRRVKA